MGLLCGERKGSRADVWKDTQMQGDWQNCPIVRPPLGGIYSSLF
jgi:hypothetical protein